MSAPTIWTIAITIVLALWLNGRYWRSRWSAVPEIHAVDNLDGESTTAVIFFAGAFNSATSVSQGMTGLWARYGDVFLVEYPLKRFDMETTIRTVRDQLSLRYTNVVLIGASMGGICCLRLRRLWDSDSHFTAEQIKIIGCDVPQSQDHLVWAARLAKYVHPGPIFNFLLSRLVTRVMFRIVKDELISEGTDMEALGRHIMAMRRYTLSGMLDHIVTIVESQVAPPEGFRGVMSVFLRSETDDVIKADPAEDDWQHTFPEACVIRVPRAFHVTFMENGPEWRAGFTQAFDQVGALQVR